MWSRSPTYLISFYALPPPEVSEIMGDTVVCAGTLAAYSAAYTEAVYYTWAVPEGWTITAGQNTSSITVRAGAEGGEVSVTPADYNGVGNSYTLNVSVSAPAAPGVATIADYICTGDISTAGSIGIADYACTGDISTAGSIGISDYSCASDITTAGSISIVAY